MDEAEHRAAGSSLPVVTDHWPQHIDLSGVPTLAGEPPDAGLPVGYLCRCEDRGHSYSAGQILYVHCRCEDCQGLRFWAFRCAARTAKLRGGQRRRDSLRAARRAPVDLEFIYVRDRGTCGLCGERVADADLSLDHVIPISKGGLHQPDNVQLAHRSCNSRKYDRDLSRAGRWPFGLTPPEHWRIPDD